MTGWEWLFLLVVVSGVTLAYLWLRRRTRQQLTEGDQESRRKLGRSHLRIAGITSSIAGTVFIVAMLVIWPAVPAGNEPFVLGFVGFGLALVLYGVYKLYRSRHEGN